MKVLRRLYRYLNSYKAWAIVAFGSMLIFAATQTLLMVLIQPLFDEVLTPPSARAAVAANKQETTKQRLINTVLKRDLPEGRRGFFINTFDRASKNFNSWWNDNPSEKWKKILTALLMVFVIRAFTSFARGIAGVNPGRPFRRRSWCRRRARCARSFRRAAAAGGRGCCAGSWVDPRTSARSRPDHR